MKRSCIFIFIIISLGAIAQDNPELSGNITIDPSKIDWTKYEGSGAVSNPMDRLTDAPPLSDLNSMPRLEIQGNSDVHEVLRTLPDFNKMMGIRSRPFTVDYSNLGQSFSLSGVNSWGLRDCPYNLVFGDNSNLNDIMKGWTSGEQCFQQVTPRAPAADRIDSDVNACKCLVNNQNNLVAYAMANKTTAVENIGTLEQTVAYNTLRLQNMRSGLLLQASLLCNSPEEARNVNPLFNNMSTEMSGVLDTYVRNARTEIASEASNSENQNSPAIQARMRELASKLEVPTADEKLLTKGFEQNANDCVSVKEYLAFNQLPAYNDFYNSLATESFDPQKWDIKVLESDLNNVVEKGGIDSREYWKLRGRIKFLQKNGLWRAVFSASDSPENKQRKEDLFNIIKSSFGNSRCKADSCRLDLMSSRKYDDYREASRRFLGRKDIAEMINTSEVERAKVEFSEAAAHNIMKRPPLPSTLDAYRQYSARFNAHLSHCDDPKNASACMVAYAQHCPEINQIQQQLQNKTARFTDGDFELESMGNTEMDPDLNPAYQEFRDAMCGPRSS
ncbi:MAG: hypothetical protein ACJ76H_09995, partial [Bacteriovoracaceae bacterium]